MDKDVVVQIKKVKEGFITECKVESGAEMFALVKSLNILNRQLKEKFNKDINLDHEISEKADSLKKEAEQRGDKDMLDIINKVEELGKKKDKNGLKQLIKDIKGLVDGK